MQAVSLSDDGKQTLVHLVFKADAQVIGRVIVNEAQLDVLARGGTTDG